MEMQKFLKGFDITSLPTGEVAEEVVTAISEKAKEWFGDFSELFKRNEDGDYVLKSPIVDEGDGGWILPSTTYITVKFVGELAEVTTNYFSNGDWINSNYKFDNIREFRKTLKEFI